MASRTISSDKMGSSGRTTISRLLTSAPSSNWLVTKLALSQTGESALPIGTLSFLAVCTLMAMAVSGVLTGTLPFWQLAPLLGVCLTEVLNLPEMAPGSLKGLKKSGQWTGMGKPMAADDDDEGDDEDDADDDGEDEDEEGEEEVEEDDGEDEEDEEDEGEAGGVGGEEEQPGEEEEEGDEEEDDEEEEGNEEDDGEDEDDDEEEEEEEDDEEEDAPPSKKSKR
eukprot:TRINITY_DN1304_c0_g1_i1.p1 TRINITY_DN1304_c0_g1~~TRINITY_DN1304_c0_g1_i1.p1  ORF type:complete len:224 (-),score=114.66 TRINITY_DN1304_c0_g1_i1:678-1349(-)